MPNNYLESLLKPSFLCAPPRNFVSKGPGWGPRFLIASKQPGDNKVAGLETTMSAELQCNTILVSKTP